jgi:hypothetical protein
VFYDAMCDKSIRTAMARKKSGGCKMNPGSRLIEIADTIARLTEKLLDSANGSLTENQEIYLQKIIQYAQNIPETLHSYFSTTGSEDDIRQARSNLAPELRTWITTMETCHHLVILYTKTRLLNEAQRQILDEMAASQKMLNDELTVFFENLRVIH